VRFIKGNCFSKVSLPRAFTKNCIVINLTYFGLQSSLALDNISNMCIKFKSLKLIHVSTAIVDGSSSDNVITEDSPCYPESSYEIAKYRSEIFLKEKLKDKINLIILRPTAIFGENCKNLIQNLKFIKYKNIFLNYLKSCVFSERKMNLVSVENVASALLFLVNSKSIQDETFIISDDDDNQNNYRSIESLFLNKLNKKYFPHQKCGDECFELSRPCKGECQDGHFLCGTECKPDEQKKGLKFFENGKQSKYRGRRLMDSVR
jgi:dTDP-D-glucose 4,6-dehydratase